MRSHNKGSGFLQKTTSIIEHKAETGTSIWQIIQLGNLTIRIGIQQKEPVGTNYTVELIYETTLATLNEELSQ